MTEHDLWQRVWNLAPDGYGQDNMKFRDAVHALVTEATLAEREACAKVAEDTLPPRIPLLHSHPTAKGIAAAIRARTATQGEGKEDAHEKEIGKLIDERDHFEDALSRAYELVVGVSPEWSNMFSTQDALDEIDGVIANLTAAPQPPASPTQGDEDLTIRNPAPDASPSRQPMGKYAIIEPPQPPESPSQEGRMRAALREMVYETTSLSPMEDDGSHWCKISREALAAARAALANDGGSK